MSLRTVDVMVRKFNILFNIFVFCSNKCKLQFKLETAMKSLVFVKASTCIGGLLVAYMKILV